MTDARAAGVQVDVAYLLAPPQLRALGVQVDVAYEYGGPPVEPPIIEPPPPLPDYGVNKVTVDVFPLDPCYVLADVTILHGRGAFGEGSQASSATVRVEIPAGGGMPAQGLGAALLLDGSAGRMFTGRITDLSIGHFTAEDGSKWGTFTVTAAGPVAALGVRMVGDEPWPTELGTARAARILGASSLSGWRVEGTTDRSVLARDVDAQPAAGLLNALAESTSAAVFDTPDGQVVYQAMQSRTRIRPYAWADFPPADTWDTFDAALTWEQMTWDSPTSEYPLTIPCDAITWEPTWRTSAANVINHIRVGYGTAQPQDVVELFDSASIGVHNRRYVYLGTDLATASDAESLASHTLITRAETRWELDEVTVNLGDLDEATRKAVFGLVCGDRVLIDGLPQPAPATALAAIVEGWTFTQTGRDGIVTEQMVLALSDPLSSLAVITWGDIDPALTWADIDPALRWADTDFDAAA